MNHVPDQPHYEHFDNTPQVPESGWCSDCERVAEECVCEELCDHFREVGNAGGEDVCLPALSPAPPQTLSPPCPGNKIPSGVGRGSLSDGGKPLLLDYPAWRLSFSAYGEHMGWEVPA